MNKNKINILNMMMVVIAFATVVLCMFITASIWVVGRAYCRLSYENTASDPFSFGGAVLGVTFFYAFLGFSTICVVADGVLQFVFGLKCVTLRNPPTLTKRAIVSIVLCIFDAIAVTGVLFANSIIGISKLHLFVVLAILIGCFALLRVVVSVCALFAKKRPDSKVTTQ